MSVSRWSEAITWLDTNTAVSSYSKQKFFLWNSDRRTRAHDLWNDTEVLVYKYTV